MENKNDEMKNSQQNLKHLGFIRIAAIKTIIWISNLYENAKENSGALKSAVVTIENAVTTVVTPVFNKLTPFPDHFLVFLDHKVDKASAKFDENAPLLVKQVASQVHGFVESTARVTKDIVHHAQVGGPLEAAYYAAEETKKVALDQSVKIWSKLDKLHPFHVVAEMTIPTAANFSEKYNKLVVDFRGKGYTVFSYVPLVPIDEIAKAFKQSSRPSSEGENVTSPTQ